MRARRWEAISRHFDRQADALALAFRPIDDALLDRYTRELRGTHELEFRLQLVGALAGQRVLDVGCGDGTQAVLLARLGARVTGLDVSPRSVELAVARAALNGVESRCDFICSPIETATVARQAFDVIWGDGILQYLRDDLRPVLLRVLSWARRGAVVVFSEPVDLRARPPGRGAPPGEPDAAVEPEALGLEELALLRRYLPDLEIKPFHAFRWSEPARTGEPPRGVRRLLTDLLARLDAACLSLPVARDRARRAVLSAQAPGLSLVAPEPADADGASDGAAVADALSSSVGDP